jgi:hypothetical protein
MPGMNPVEKIQRDMKIVELVKGAKRPLPTSFRKSHSFTMPVELCELLSRLRTEYNINVSAEMEPVIKKKAMKIVRSLHQNSKETK